MKLVGLHPEQQVDLIWVIPGQSAIGCPPADEGFQSLPAFNDVPPATKIKFSRNPRLQDARNSKAWGFRFYDHANRTVHARNYYKFNRFPNESISVPLTTYSCKFEWSYAGGGGFIGCFPHLITFLNGNATTGIDAFSLMHTDYQSGTTANRPFVKGATNSINLVNPNTLSAGFQMLGGYTYRVEIQVKPTNGPLVTGGPNVSKVTIKIYRGRNSTTVWRTLSCDPADVSADRLMLGRHPTKCGAPYYVGEYWIGDVELFDTYNMDGTVGTAYQTPVNKWYKMAGGVEVPMNEIGTIHGSTLDTTDKNNFYDFDREFIYDASNYTMVNFYYDGGGARSARNATLWYPNRTPPPGGWPLVSWWHGGFYSGGDKADVDENWVKWLLYEGFAVTTGEWIVSQQIITNAINQTPFPNQHGGRFPSFVIDPKLLALYLEERGTHGTGQYPINTNLTCICGHSAGAGIALMAAVSRDMTLNGQNLSVNNTLYGRGTGRNDPAFKCCYLWAPPTDLWWAYNNDPTYPLFGSLIRTTACAFLGRNTDSTLVQSNLTGTSPLEMIAAQDSAKIPPIGAVIGINDGVVPWNHVKFLGDALFAKNGYVLNPFYSNKDHIDCYLQGPENHFLQFLHNNGM